MEIVHLVHSVFHYQYFFNIRIEQVLKLLCTSCNISIISSKNTNVIVFTTLPVETFKNPNHVYRVPDSSVKDTLKNPNDNIDALWDTLAMFSVTVVRKEQ